MATRSVRLITYLILGALILTACSFPGVGNAVTAPTQMPPEAIYTAAALTLAAQLTQNAPPVIQATQPEAIQPTQADTPIPPSPTSTSLVPSSTPTLQSTATSPFTATPSYPMITASVDTNCRSGPGPEYPRVGYLLAGQTSQVYGRNSSSTWWYIKDPNKTSLFCWVWGGSTNVAGASSMLPVFTPPPPPPTSTPGKAAFTASYVSTKKCGGDKYAIFSIKNVSGVTFESMSIKTRDETKDEVVSNASSNKPFLDSSSDCPPGASALDPGEKAYVASLTQGAKSGNDAKTNIYLCTKDGLDGTCVMVVVKYTFP
jgi:uncharacterized protein YgiM (DUF1202 family)